MKFTPGTMFACLYSVSDPVSAAAHRCALKARQRPVLCETVYRSTTAEKPKFGRLHYYSALTSIYMASSRSQEVGACLEHKRASCGGARSSRKGDDKLLQCRNHQSRLAGARQIHGDAVAPVVAQRVYGQALAGAGYIHSRTFTCSSVSYA